MEPGGEGVVGNVIGDIKKCSSEALRWRWIDYEVSIKRSLLLRATLLALPPAHCQGLPHPLQHVAQANQSLVPELQEKQHDESSRMQTVNRKRIAMKKLLMEENDRLQKQLSGLIFEKEALAKSLKTRIHQSPRTRAATPW